MLKNDNMPRDSRRSLANKNSMWYDLNICNKTWENAIKSLLSDVNSCKVNFKTKLQSLSICASAIEQQQLIPLKDLALPHHKYLPYDQAKLLVQYFKDRGLEMPKFLKIPDFYLPSKNINHIFETKQEVMEDDEQF